MNFEKEGAAATGACSGGYIAPVFRMLRPAPTVYKPPSGAGVAHRSPSLALFNDDGKFLSYSSPHPICSASTLSTRRIH